MTRTDRKLICAALAFLAVVMKDGDVQNAADVERVRQLAALIERFCVEHVTSVLAPLSEEADLSAIDQLIERHIGELRDNEETRLPEDRETLIKVHDRLQLRKQRRMRREFYAFASEEKLADLVLELLDEEIDGEGNAGLA